MMIVLTSSERSFKVGSGRPPGRFVSGVALVLLAIVSWSAAQSGGVEALLAGARESVERAPRYDGRYVGLGYPGGDPGWGIGVCTDVVIRAFRRAGVDLQRLVHEDILVRPEAYGVGRADASIDHRRVRNLAVFFRRHAKAVPITGEWRPGDIVIWSLSGSGYPDHIGVIAERAGPSGDPLVYHHFPKTARFSGHPETSDCLHLWRILGHFRWPWGSPTAPAVE